MPQFAIGTPGQEPRMFLSVVEETDAQANARPGEVVFAATYTGQRTVIDATGSFLEPYVMPLIEAQWMRSIAAVQYRDSIANGTCPVPLPDGTTGSIDLGGDSKTLLTSAVLDAYLSVVGNTPYSLRWTMADGTVQVFTAEQAIAIGKVAAQFRAACQDAGTAINAQIEAATTTDAVAAIDITAGYPAT
jgi:hypothetical protein